MNIIKKVLDIAIIVHSNYKQKRNILFIEKKIINWFGIVRKNIINWKVNIRSSLKIKIILIKTLSNFLLNIKNLIKTIIKILI